MENTLQKIVKKIIKNNPQTRKEIADIKRRIAGDLKLPPPLNADLLKVYQKLLKKGKIKQNKQLELLLKKREIRTLSGVAPIAVLTKPHPCPGRCAYCPTEKSVPKSYLSNEPAVMRAIACGYDPYRQVAARIKTLEANGHPTNKLELIVIGGTWSVLPRRYQTWFIKRCFQAANGQRNKETKKQRNNSLESAQKKNETAAHRIIGITLETRPDYITPKEIKVMRKLGATRVELGVQTIDDKILKKNLRGHNVSETVRATKLLKDAGFKVCYHMMPNLPGSTPARDLQVFREIFTNPDFQPDMIKIYPCVVTHGSKIYKWWKQGKYKSYSEKQLIELLINIKKIIPPYVRINRLIRDIPGTSIEAGNKISNLREVVSAEMARRNLACKCIRCREVGHYRCRTPFQTGVRHLSNKRSFIRKYKASDGQEYFISFESPNKKILYAFLRLRIPSQLHSDNNLHLSDSPLTRYLPELRNAAIVRELHTYGYLVPIDQTSPSATQHIGLGKKLMAEAEKTVKNLGIKKIAVISGVGVREYYKKLGYHLEETYMVKNL